MEPLEIALSISITNLVPDELVVDGLQGEMITLRLLSAVPGDVVTVCAQGKEPAGSVCGELK